MLHLLFLRVLSRLQVHVPLNQVLRDRCVVSAGAELLGRLKLLLRVEG